MPVINVEKTGNNIKEYIYNNGLTVKNIQETLGLATPNAVYKWINGFNLPTLDNLVILADVFDVTVEEILVVERV